MHILERGLLEIVRCEARFSLRFFSNFLPKLFDLGIRRLDLQEQLLLFPLSVADLGLRELDDAGACLDAGAVLLDLPPDPDLLALALGGDDLAQRPDILL